jgi:serine/threonine protein kinase
MARPRAGGQLAGVNADRWRQVNELFHAALQHDAAERETLLKITAETDPELAREVQSLLERHERAEGFLDVPAWGVAADLILDKEPSLVGKQLGSYRVLEEIGRGGMGIVYAARDERLGRTVALKALSPEYTTDRRQRDRLAREARAAAAFTHEAIATVFALEEIDGELYIASELVRGATLRQELAAGPIPPERLIDTLIEIASGLAAAHGRNIIHRDLKPENIIRRTDGHIKILDFGLARITDPQTATITRLTEPGTTPGTPGYMAPEQLSGSEVDARADVFAFGVVAWELSTGDHPFGSNRAIMMARMLEARPGTLPRQLLTPELDAIVHRCVRVAPEERYPTADALLEDLRRLKTSSGSRHPALASVDDVSGLWWWQFHQAIVAAVDASTPILVAMLRPALSFPFSTWLVLAVLALATAAVTLRLNLLFTARVQRALLLSHRSRLFPWIAAAETALAVLLLVAAGLVSETRQAMAAVLVSLAIVMVASLALIEPATTGGAGLERQKAAEKSEKV